MIQRIQTLYFLAIVVSCAMMLFGDVAFYEVKTSNENTVTVEYDSTAIKTAEAESDNKNTTLNYFILCVAVLALASLLFFKNRKLQLKLASINFLFILGLVVMMYIMSIQRNYFEGLETTGGLTWFALMPLALVFLNYLGLRGIQRDEKLIRSMDRLR